MTTDDALTLVCIIGVPLAIGISLWLAGRWAMRGERDMKKIVNITEVSGEGFEKLLGECVTLFCMNYIYTGRLAGVNSDCVLLENPAIVYETGAFTDKMWKDAQALPTDLYIMKASIEAFGLVK